jgi:tetratricopeptide (TPR) repeat protein
VRPAALTVWAALLSLAVIASPARAEESWATTRARDLVEQGHGQIGAGHPEVAAARFREAVGLDATFGPAYLAWGALLEEGRDFVEAERIYAMGIARVARFADGYAARGRLRARLRRFDGAVADLEAAARLRPDDLGLLASLGGALVQAGAWPAALGVERTIARLAEKSGDHESAARARRQVSALQKLLADLDPVMAGATDDRGWVRRAIATFAQGSRAPVEARP